MGANRSKIKAKIFGGANLFSFSSPKGKSVGEQNIEFAEYYLNSENIPIISSDTGKNYGRKIFFDTSTGYVKLFKLTDKQKDEITIEEKNYLNNIKENELQFEEETDEGVTLF